MRGMTSSPSRRTVLTTAIWSAPVVAVAAAAPMAAASTDPRPAGFYFFGSSDATYPGGLTRALARGDISGANGRRLDITVTSSNPAFPILGFGQTNSDLSGFDISFQTPTTPGFTTLTISAPGFASASKTYRVV